MDEQIKQLAETLKKNGLAASMLEAIEKAKAILNVKTVKTDTQEKKMPTNQDYDITKETASLNELMKEINVTPEQVEAQKQEKVDNIKTEINNIKEDIKEAENAPEKTEQIKEEIEKVKEEVSEITEDTTEEAPQENKQEEDIFKEEKKVDLTKVFNQNKK